MRLERLPRAKLSTLAWAVSIRSCGNLALKRRDTQPTIFCWQRKRLSFTEKVDPSIGLRDTLTIGQKTAVEPREQTTDMRVKAL